MSERSLTKNQVRWMARRGMLELDLLLNRYIDLQFSDLTQQQVEVFVALMLEQDPTLHSWFFTDAVSENSQFSDMVLLIKQCQLDAG